MTTCNNKWKLSQGPFSNNEPFVKYNSDGNIPPDRNTSLIPESIAGGDSTSANVGADVSFFKNGWSMYWNKSDEEVVFSVRFFTEDTFVERFVITFTLVDDKEVPVIAKVKGNNTDHGIVPDVNDIEDNKVSVYLGVDIPEGSEISGRVYIFFTCGKENGNIVFGKSVILGISGFSMNVDYATPPSAFKTPCGNIGGPLTISVSQDAFGNELGEIAAAITSGTNYNWQTYPQEDVGANTSIGLPLVAVGDYLNLFSFKPDLRSVLLGNSRAKTLYGQVKTINNTQLTDGEFFNRILIYSAARFILSGLLYGEFKAEWLLREHYYKFVVDLSMDENLSVYGKFFTSKVCQYSDYHEYFKGGQVCFPCQGS